MTFGRKTALSALLLTAALLLLLAQGGRDQRSLARQVVRLHVLANSDSEDDQRLKLRVRDAVLAQAEPLLEGTDSQQAAYECLSAHLEVLRQAGECALAAGGGTGPVVVTLGEDWFPTRRYGDFALPAGRYLTLRVSLGAAAGRNWWCVVYPPLCRVGVEQAEPASLGLTGEQVGLIGETDGAYEIRFRLMEWWGTLEQRLRA